MQDPVSTNRMLPQNNNLQGSGRGSGMKELDEETRWEIQ